MSPGPLQAKDDEEGPPRNERADIGLMCLRLFMVGQQALAATGTPHNTDGVVVCMLGDLIPVVPPAFRHIRILVPTTRLVPVTRSAHKISAAATYQQLLSAGQPPLPSAWKNCQRTSGPDSWLLLELVDPAPEDLCRPYRKKLANMRTLAILIQSKQRRSEDARKKEEEFDKELRKCWRCPFPFLFVMITDSECAHLPDRPNAIYVGQQRLEELYGPVLYSMRVEEWHMTKPGKDEEDPEEEEDDPEEGEDGDAPNLD